MSIISGIYRIICVSNGNYYYGSSKDIWRRWTFHKNTLIAGTHKNYKLQDTWNSYGELSFKIELVETAPIELLESIETKYLLEHVGNPHCMNISIDSTSPTRNRKMGPRSDEIKKKISKSLTGRRMKEETKKKISNTLTGYEKTKEHRENLSKALTGKRMSDESRQKIRESKIGKRLSEETKRKMRESHRKRTQQ